ncbi:hypothetical protein IWZ03DRAFT_414648 [Phyllosticta citriasiana]|uniref:Pheromone-regulated membrane protein n=1 Tax=Phyllosticta citriasiana TaxID=595635 RepID=A0ABR1KNC8_9PEZI
MPCFGRNRDNEGAISEDSKWDYITLTDFTSSSWKTKLSYLWLWILSAINIAVYAADTFTAVNLLAFNKWSSQVNPTIKLSISKWIFAGCIIFSWVLCGFEWIRALRVIRRGGVADSYLDPLAARLQSSRIYKGGRGWRRFLVFAELTKSKKGVDYIALFVYFQFKGAIRILLAEGPRQVVNALTLWAAMKADLLPVGDHAAKDNTSGVDQFFKNLETLADQNKEQAVILSTMLFTLVVWVFSALALILAAVFYLLFLWHYIPSVDGSLSRYCRRKVDKRLDRVVSNTTRAALDKADKEIRLEEEKAARKAAANAAADGRPTIPRNPTLPNLNGSPESLESDFKYQRSDQSSVSTLPLYSSRQPTRSNSSTTLGSANRSQVSRKPTLPQLPPAGIHRTDTQDSSWSSTSYGSNATLLGNASDMGGNRGPPRYNSPAPPVPPINPQYERSLTNGPQQRAFTPAGRPVPTPNPGRGGPPAVGRPDGYGPPRRNDTGFSVGQDRSFTPMGHPQGPPPQNRGTPGPGMYGPPPRSDTAFSAGQQRSFTPHGQPPMGQPHMAQQDYYNHMEHGRGPTPMGRPSPGPMRNHTPMGRYIPAPPGHGESEFASYDYNRRSPGPQGPAYEMQHQSRNNTPHEQYHGGFHDQRGHEQQSGHQQERYQNNFQEQEQPLKRPMPAHLDDYDPFRAETPPLRHRPRQSEQHTVTRARVVSTSWSDRSDAPQHNNYVPFNHSALSQSQSQSQPQHQHQSPPEPSPPQLANSPPSAEDFTLTDESEFDLEMPPLVTAPRRRKDRPFSTLYEASIEDETFSRTLSRAETTDDNHTSVPHPALVIAAAAREKSQTSLSSPATAIPDARSGDTVLPNSEPEVSDTETDNGRLGAPVTATGAATTTNDDSLFNSAHASSSYSDGEGTPRASTYRNFSEPLRVHHNRRTYHPPSSSSDEWAPHEGDNMPALRRVVTEPEAETNVLTPTQANFPPHGQRVVREDISEDETLRRLRQNGTWGPGGMI